MNAMGRGVWSVVVAGVIVGSWASLATAGFVFWEPEVEVTYSNPDDLGDLAFVEVDVEGGAVFEFRVFESGDGSEAYLSGVEITRNGGFIGDFDDNDMSVFRVLEPNDVIDASYEDDLHVEQTTYAAYEMDEFGVPISGGNLEGSEVYIGFGYYGTTEPDDEDATVFGWMLVEFGLLRDDPATVEPEAFIRIKQVSYNTTQDPANPGFALPVTVASRVPEPTSLALVTAGAGLLAGRRKRGRKLPRQG